MAGYSANAVDIPAVMSSSNGDYVRTGGPQALFTAGDNKFVTYTYANGLDATPAISGGFQPLYATLPSAITGFSLFLQTTVKFVNPTNAAGSLTFTVLQTDHSAADVAALSVTHTFSTLISATSGFVTTTDSMTTGLGQLQSVRFGTMRWTINWTSAAVAGQSLILDRVWLAVAATTTSTLTAPALNATVGRFDPRQDWVTN